MRAQVARAAHEDQRRLRGESRSTAGARDRDLRCAQDASARFARRHFEERLQARTSGGRAVATVDDRRNHATLVERPLQNQCGSRLSAAKCECPTRKQVVIPNAYEESHTRRICILRPKTAPSPNARPFALRHERFLPDETPTAHSTSLHVTINNIASFSFYIDA